MPPWFSAVTSAQKKESKFNSSRWVQLATIGEDSTPRVRTVVFRGWTKTYEMKIFTDKRSQKYHELDTNNNIEVCWLFAHSKCQFRFRGTSKIDLSANKIKEWNQLSNSSKEMWNWPYPGEHFQIKNINDKSIKNIKVISNNYVLLKFNFTYVEQLLLHQPIHIRRRWIKKDKWIEERINP